MAVGRSRLSVWHTSHWHCAQKFFHVPLKDRFWTERSKEISFPEKTCETGQSRQARPVLAIRPDQTRWLLQVRLWERPGRTVRRDVRRRHWPWRPWGHGERGQIEKAALWSGGSRTEENTHYFNLVINDHKELKIQRLKINVRIYSKETMEYTQVFMYKGICCSIIYNTGNFKVISMSIYMYII